MVAYGRRSPTSPAPCAIPFVVGQFDHAVPVFPVEKPSRLCPAAWVRQRAASSRTMNTNQTMSRRSFMAASGIGALVSPTVATLAQTPQLLTKPSVKPVVVASGNGNKSRDAAGSTCVAKAFQTITSGADVLESLIAGVNII